MLRSIVIAGVGGQGTLLASKILSEAAQKKGLFVRTSETIGMAQRGGSVSSHLRIGAEDVSPVIPFRHADILLAFELAEAVRQLTRVSPNARGVINTDCLIPTNVVLRQGVYLKDEYVALLKESLHDSVFISGNPIALEAGDARSLNMVLLGAGVGAGILPFSEADILEVMKELIKPKLIGINVHAFELGIRAGKQ